MAIRIKSVDTIPLCSKCGDRADFRFGRPEAVEWEGHIWPAVESHDTCIPCFERDFPDEVAIQKEAFSIFERNQELNG